MPAVTSNNPEDQNDCDQKMWSALKRYILKDRQRKKEEYEAEVEEERLRKEREAREREDVMTLEETKEQIEQLEQKVKQLEVEKRQLFMQLKKLLNEDGFRKIQQREPSVMERDKPPMKMPMSNIQGPMYSAPPPQGQEPPTQRPPQMSSHMMNKPMGRPVQAGIKRQRSPSPTYALYAHRMHQPPIKQHVYSDHKLEDGRMGRQMARAVLWNKPPQYASNVTGPSSGYYAMPSSSVGHVVDRPPPLLYAHHAHTPHTPHSTHRTNMMYVPAPQPPPQAFLEILKHMEQPPPPLPDKKDSQPQVVIGLSDGHHPPTSSVSFAPPPPPPVSRHLSIHPSQHANMQNSKTGSISQGYPVQQSNPNVQNPNMYPNRHRY